MITAPAILVLALGTLVVVVLFWIFVRSVERRCTFSDEIQRARGDRRLGGEGTR